VWVSYDPAGAIPGNGTMADPLILVIGDDVIFEFCVEDLDRDVVTAIFDEFTPWDSAVIALSTSRAVPACGADECCWFTTSTIGGPVGTWRMEFSVLDAEGYSDIWYLYYTIS
jgi:hypothetical protein